MHLHLRGNRGRMRIAITGASGNVGSALVRRLRRDGHELVGIVRRPPAGDDGVEWHAADLTTDASDGVLREAFAGADAVVHLAWGFQPTHRVDHLEALGVGGTRRVVRTAVELRVPHLVHQSSIGAYSPRRDSAPVDEEFPTDGIPSSPYSRHKVAAERLLDDVEREQDGTTITRMRPGIIGQRQAGSALLRYGVPVLVPARLVRAVPVLPLDRGIVVPLVHADDVAGAIAAALDARVPGPFNLAAGTVGVDDVADALGARHVHVPARILRAAVSASWHLRLQQVDPGWLDLARLVPALDTTRALGELGWIPRKPARQVLDEVVDGLASADSGDTPVLRARSVPRELARLLDRGPVSRRRHP